MLTKNQQGYLDTVPDDKVAHVVPYDPAVRATAETLISEIAAVAPSSKIIYFGSSKLGVAGENDIDLILLGGERYEDLVPKLEPLLGKPIKMELHKKIIRFESERNGFPVELLLTDVMTPDIEEQVRTQEILEADASLRAEYEQMKLAANGLPWKEYLIRKYEFWNKTLGII